MSKRAHLHRIDRTPRFCFESKSAGHSLTIPSPCKQHSVLSKLEPVNREGRKKKNLKMIDRTRNGIYLAYHHTFQRDSGKPVLQTHRLVVVEATFTLVFKSSNDIKENTLLQQQCCRKCSLEVGHSGTDSHKVTHREPWGRPLARGGRLWCTCMLGGGQRELFCAGLGGHLVQTQLIPDLRQLNSREVRVNCSRSHGELLNVSIS